LVGGTGVLVGVITRNEPLFTLVGIGAADGSDATTLPSERDDGPPFASDKTSKCTCAITPSEMTF